MCERCDVLAKKIEYLQAEVVYLKGELGHIDAQEQRNFARKHLGLTRSEFEVLRTLYAGRKRNFVSVYVLEDNLQSCSPSGMGASYNKLKVYVCKVRRKIGADTILNVWGDGYKLTAKGIAAFEKAMT